MMDGTPGSESAAERIEGLETEVRALRIAILALIQADTNVLNAAIETSVGNRDEARRYLRELMHDHADSYRQIGSQGHADAIKEMLAADREGDVNG